MSRPFMPFYDGDWMRDTAHLSDTQERAYFRLVMFYWANESLPNDERQLARICRMDPRTFRKNRSTISDFFAISCDGIWIHKRIELELEKNRKFIEKQRLNGASGNAKKYYGDRQTRARAPVPQPQPYKESFNGGEKGKEMNGKSAPLWKQPSDAEPEVSSGVYVKSDTPQGDAWNAYCKATKGVSQVWDKKGGWYFNSEWPPGDTHG